MADVSKRSLGKINYTALLDSPRQDRIHIGRTDNLLLKIFHLRLGMSQQFSLSAPLEHCDLKLPLYCRKHTAETKAKTSDAAETKEAVDDQRNF